MIHYDVGPLPAGMNALHQQLPNCIGTNGVYGRDCAPPGTLAPTSTPTDPLTTEELSSRTTVVVKQVVPPPPPQKEEGKGDDGAKEPAAFVQYNTPIDALPVCNPSREGMSITNSNCRPAGTLAQVEADPVSNRINYGAKSQTAITTKATVKSVTNECNANPELKNQLPGKTCRGEPAW